MEGVPGVRLSSCICLLSFGFLLVIVVAAANSPKQLIGRSSFPKGFKFGAGSSAYQVEGAASEGGRGPSIWDTFSHIKGTTTDGSNGDVAVDQYHRYKEDVQLLKYMGMDAYRFSISWSRIFPKGSPRHGAVNEEGIAYYNNLINELLKNGIEPFVTLYHWDMPQVLEDEYGGFLSKRVVDDFGIFAEVCFRAFGDRVKYWVTVNEPLMFSLYGYDLGLIAPGRCSTRFGNYTAGNSATEPYIVAHNLLLAHSVGVKIYRTKYQVRLCPVLKLSAQIEQEDLHFLNKCWKINAEEAEGSIGITLVADWFVPFSKSLSDKRATQRLIDFRIGWFMDPLTSGKYPDSMRRLVGARLPRFSREEAKDLKGSFDFIGYNYYYSQFSINNPIQPNSLLDTDYVLDARANLTFEVNGVFIGSTEDVSGFRSYPAGLGEVLNYTKHRYNNPTIYITESGYAGFDNGTTPLVQALNDPGRVKYHDQHLAQLREAIIAGSDVRGYLVWSLLDDFEWLSGFTSRFGLYYVDQNNNLKRYARASALWFKHILRM